MKSLEVITKEVINQLPATIREAIEKHGDQPEITVIQQYVITAEEFGEIAADIQAQSGHTPNYKNAKKEIMQTIAMLTKLYWYIERNE